MFHNNNSNDQKEQPPYIKVRKSYTIKERKTKDRKAVTS